MRRLLISALLLFIACDNEPTTSIAPAASFSVVSGDGQSGTVGQPLANPLVIKATDSKGRAIRNLVIEFRVTSGGGSTSPATATTNNQGFAQTSWTLGTSTADTQRVEARAISTGQVFGTFTATAIAGQPAAMVMTSPDSQTTARLTAVPIPPAVRITDQYGNPVPGKPVTFTIPFYDVGGGVTGSPAVSNAAGIATLGSWVVGSAVGRHWVQARIPELPYGLVTFTAVGTLENGARMAEYHGSHQVTKINVAFPLGPAVRITDASGNPIEGAKPTWAQVQGSASLAGGSNASRADGVADYTTWTPCCTRGTITVRVTLAGSPDTVFISSIAEAGAAATIAVQAGNGQTALTNAAVAIAPAVVVRDTFSNPVPGVSVDFAVTAGGGSVAGNAAITDTNGIARIGAWTLGSAPGANSLSATATGVADAGVFNATAFSGGVNGDHSTIAATPQTIAASSGGTTSTVSVIARNALDNPVPGAMVTFAASGTGNTIIQPSAPTDSFGRATGRLSSTAAGPKVVTATIDGVTVTQTTTVTVRAGPAATVAIYAGDNQTALTGARVPILPAVIARDAFGNPAPGAELQFSIELGGGQIGGGSGGRITGDDGLAYADWTLGTSPGRNVMSVWSSALQTGLSFNATAVTRAASIEVQAGDGQTAPVRTAVPIQPTVLVRDSSGAPLSGAWVDFRVTRGGGSVSYPYPYWYFRTPIKTDADGLARLYSWTLGPYGETNTLDARVTGTDMAVTFTATATGSAWTRPADLPTQRFLLGAAEVGGLIYAVGGEDFTELATVEAYDPITDTWATKTPMPTARYGPGVAAIGGRLYAVGGILGNDILGTLEVYDPTTNAWTTKAPMPTPRAVLAVSVVNGILYAIGGGACVAPSPGAACSWQSVGTVEAYDPVTDTWTTKAPMPTPRHSLGAANVNGIIYAVGGQDTGFPEYFVATVEAYDPATDTWTSKSSMPTPRYSLGVVALNGIVHALGGDGPPAITTLDTHETYDPASNTWTVLPAMPSTRSYPGVAVFNGVLYVIGGNGSFATVEAYHP